nr:glycoside hydrolase family 2 TIM barrel-domain containing protein [Metabacillus niabensis]
MTEYGANTVAGFHEVVPVLFTEEFQNEYLRINHEVFNSIDTFIGKHVWNFADFSTYETLTFWSQISLSHGLPFQISIIYASHYK